MCYMSGDIQKHESAGLTKNESPNGSKCGRLSQQEYPHKQLAKTSGFCNLAHLFQARRRTAIMSDLIHASMVIISITFCSSWSVSSSSPMEETFETNVEDTNVEEMIVVGVDETNVEAVDDFSEKPAIPGFV